MAITEQQKKERRGFIGSSDIAAILGLDKYRNAMDVWAEKTGRLPDSSYSPEVADIGNMIEPGLVLWGAKEAGYTENDDVILDERVVHPGGILAVNFDGIARDRTTSFEAKTSGLMSPIPEKDQWGEAGSADVPMQYLMQTQTHFAVEEGLKRCYLAALLGGIGRRLFEIPRDDELVHLLTEAAHEFWRNHVEKDIAPDCSPSPNTYKRLRRIKGKTVPVDAALVAAWQRASKAATLAEQAKNEAAGELHKQLGDAEIGEYVDGDVTKYVTYNETHRKGYEVKATSFRTLRLTSKLKD